MATVTARIEDIDRHAVNKPPGSKVAIWWTLAVE